MPRAIEFVEAHDKELWYQLIEHSLRNEAFLSGLLDHAGVYDVDLARLVAEIPKGMHIPGLRDKVVKIISDYRFQVSELSGLIGKPPSIFLGVLAKPKFDVCSSATWHLRLRG